MKMNMIYTVLVSAMLGLGMTTMVQADTVSDSEISATLRYEVEIPVMVVKDTAAKTSDMVNSTLDQTIEKYTRATLLGESLDGLAKIAVDSEVYFVSSDSITDNAQEIQDLETQQKKELEAKKAAEEAAKKAEEEKKAAEEAKKAASTWNGPVLTASAGVNQGPSGKETYYNLPMEGVVSIMRSMGNTDAYWVRSDGAKMLGDYVMVAANLSLRPRGSLIMTSLGMGIVCDTGGFASSNPTQLDIATAW